MVIFMSQFDNVVCELRKWLTSFPLVNFLMPFSLILMFGGLGLSLLYELILLGLIYTSILSLLPAVGHFAFLIGFWLCLISNEVKWTPYGLFAKAILYLFPFTSIYISSLIYAAVDAYLGYWLLKYTALSDSCNQRPNNGLPM
jgi:hypothetical protein